MTVAPLAILDNGVQERQGPVLSYALARADVVLSTAYDWSLWVEMAAYYFREVELALAPCSWGCRQYYLPLAMMRRSVRSFLGKVSTEQRQSPLGLIRERNFRALFPKRAGKDIIRY